MERLVRYSKGKERGVFILDEASIIAIRENLDKADF
jgi:hypothetical protein